jgi:hypothetical protein
MPVLTSLKEACLRNCSTIIEMELHQSTSGLQYQTSKSLFFVHSSTLEFFFSKNQIQTLIITLDCKTWI